MVVKEDGNVLVQQEGCMARKGRANVATRLIVDDFGQMALFRRCGLCRRWLPQAIGYFSPRKRDERRRVIRWDNRCLSCRARNNREYWAGLDEQRRHEANHRRWESLKADPERWAARRRENAELMARRRQDPEQAERQREAHRAWYRSMKADPVKYAGYLERARINYRLRQERQGRNLDVIRAVSTVVRAPEVSLCRLPAKPLADAIDRQLSKLSPTDESLEDLLRRRGVEARSLHGWRRGERTMVQFTVADAALTGMGLNWFDVWDPGRYPKVAAALGMEAA